VCVIARAGRSICDAEWVTRGSLSRHGCALRRYCLVRFCAGSRGERTRSTELLEHHAFSADHLESTVPDDAFVPLPSTIKLDGFAHFTWNSRARTCRAWRFTVLPGFQEVPVRTGRGRGPLSFGFTGTPSRTAFFVRVLDGVLNPPRNTHRSEEMTSSRPCSGQLRDTSARRLKAF
jgi:hypothetical protein